MKNILLAVFAAQVCSLIYNHLKFKSIMATLAEVQQALTDLQTSVDANQEQVIARIQELKDQIANGGTVTEADLDTLITQINATRTDIEDTDEG